MKKISPFTLEVNKKYYDSNKKCLGVFVRYTSDLNPVFRKDGNFYIIDKENDFYILTIPKYLSITCSIVITMLFLSLLIIDLDSLNDRQLLFWCIGFLSISIIIFILYGEKG
jgi:hypothetical protein